MRIRFLFIFSAALLCGVAILSSLTLIYFVTRARSLRHDILDSLEISSLAYRVENALLSHQRDNYFFKVTRDKKYLDRRSKSRTQLQNLVSELRLFDESKDSVYLNSVFTAVDSYFSIFESLRFAKGTPYRVFLDLSEPATQVRKEIHELLEDNGAKIERRRIELMVAEKSATRLGYFFAGLLPLVAICLLTVWRALIVRPLEAVSNSISAYRTGSAPPVEKVAGVLEIEKTYEAFRDLSTQLNNDQKSRFEFLAAVTHDLQNPLGAIRSAAQILLSEPAPNAFERKITLEIIQRQSESLSHLVEDLKLAAGAAVGKLRFDRSHVDLRRLVLDLATLYASADARNRVMVFTPDHSVICSLDPNRFHQVMHNLISNALKYSHAGSEIRLELHVDRKLAHVFVVDEGDGLRPEDLRRIFEPFQRGRQSGRQTPGLGIGLATSKKIVEQMGGSIDVESKPGVGSKFKVTFPLVQSVQNSPIPSNFQLSTRI